MRLPQSAAAQAAELEVEAAWRAPVEAGDRARWERVEAENADGSVTLRADLDGEGKVRTIWKGSVRGNTRHLRETLSLWCIVIDIPLGRYPSGTVCHVVT